jgi:hypothetical protein
VTSLDARIADMETAMRAAVKVTLSKQKPD